MSKFCQYNCLPNGTYFNRDTRTFLPCPEHTKARSKEVREGIAENGEEVYKLLGFSENYLSYMLDPNAIISRSQLAFLDKQSVERTKAGVEELVNNLTLGIAPKHSVVIGLDRQFNADAVAVPLLLNAYKSGLSVAPFISAPDYRINLVREDNDVYTKGTASTFRDVYLNREVVVMVIPSGVSEQDVLEAKGLMQARAVKGKSTIFLTSRPKEHLTEVCAIDEDEATRYCALFLGVSYKAFNATEKRAKAFQNNNRNPNALTLSDLDGLTPM